MPLDVVLALRDAFDRSDVISGQSGARMLRQVSLVHIVGPEAPLLLVVMPFWEEACYAFVAGLSVAVVLAVCIGSGKVMTSMWSPLHSLSSLVLLQFSSFVGVSSL